jgi:hypothetical protein
MPSPSSFDPKTFAPTHAANVATLAGALGGTYTATEQATLTSMKTAVNAILLCLKEAGLMNQD